MSKREQESRSEVPSRSESQRSSTNEYGVDHEPKRIDWPWFTVGCVILLVALTACLWAFSFEYISPSRRFLLMWLLPLASGFGCGCFVGSARLSGPIGSVVVAATGGFAVWILSFLLLPNIPEPSKVTSPLPNPTPAPLADRVLSQWKLEHKDLIRTLGYPGGEPTQVRFWYQYYTSGLMLLNTSVRTESFIFYNKDHHWKQVEHPAELISQSHIGIINLQLLDRLLGPDINVSKRQEYITMLTEKADPSEPLLMGGTGTLYVSEHLLDEVGKPLNHETHINDAVIIHGPPYDLIVNVINSATDGTSQQIVRAVIVLFPNHQYEQQVIQLTVE